jgi:hypothetical protein
MCHYGNPRQDDASMQASRAWYHLGKLVILVRS